MPRAHLIFVGDYVDRGDNSAAVLTRLQALEAAGQGQVICLKGNHEAMLLDFLDQPEAKGRRWLKNGGLQTLASFGVRGSGADFQALHAAFTQALPAGMVDWLRARPLIWQSGSLAVVHAAVDPTRALSDQSDRCLLWGHKAFFRRPHRAGGWVAHGHTIMDQATAQGGRISVDTGAYATQVLTAARVTPDGGVRFLQTP
jgi:serine/threonine protein phosphatase 1